MKKFFKAMLAVLTVIVLASCSKVTEGYAEKINVAAVKEEHYTYSQVVEDLGMPHVDLTIDFLGSRNGWAAWYKGYETAEEAEAALEAGKTVASITITVSDNKVTKAEYKEETKEVKE